MRVIIAALLLGSCAVAGADPSPWAPGKYSIQTESGKLGNDSHWTYGAYAPDDNGSFPVMIYITGGGGIMPCSTYGDVLKAMSAKGLVIVCLYKIRQPQPKTDAALLAKGLPWLKNGGYSSIGLKAKANFDELTLSGHSAGNHVICDYLQTSCGMAKAVVMMDPVDGYDPFGVVKNYCITPGQKVEFSTPALLLRTGLDPVVKRMVACAPDQLSNQRFFDAWAGPIWMANATKYGHLDLNGNQTGKMGRIICASDNEPKPLYHSQVAGLTHAFLSMVFKGDTASEQVLKDAAEMPADTIAQNDYNGHKAPFSAGCTHSATTHSLVV